MWMVSLVSLSLVAALCVVGVFHGAFRDTLLQRIGMAWLCIACCGRVRWVWLNQTTDPSWMMVHVGMAIYAVGTFSKVYFERHRLVTQHHGAEPVAE